MDREGSAVFLTWRFQTMLVLSRRESERIFIGPNIVIQIVRVRGGSVRVGIEAPPEIVVVREELLDTETEE
jgi:carbon storage regulator CsrA